MLAMSQKSILSFFSSPKSSIKSPQQIVHSSSKSTDKKEKSPTDKKKDIKKEVPKSAKKNAGARKDVSKSAKKDMDPNKDVSTSAKKDVSMSAKKDVSKNAKKDGSKSAKKNVSKSAKKNVSKSAKKNTDATKNLFESEVENVDIKQKVSESEEKDVGTKQEVPESAGKDTGTKNDVSKNTDVQVNGDSKKATPPKQKESPKKGENEATVPPPRKTARKQVGGWKKKILNDNATPEEKKSKVVIEHVSVTSEVRQSVPESEDNHTDEVVNDKKRKAEEHTSTLQSESSDEEDEIPRVRKRPKKNVILDDSPIKQPVHVPKAALDNYSNRLDKFMMKPRENSVNVDSVKINVLLKSEEDKMDVSEVKNESDITEVNNESNRTEVKNKSDISEVNNESNRTEVENESDKSDMEDSNECDMNMDAEEDKADDEIKKSDIKDKKPITNAFDVLKKKVTPEDEKGNKKVSNTKNYWPSKHNYHPIDDACWKKGENVPYLALATTLEEIENTSGRLKMIEILANYFRSVIALSPDDLLQSIYLCLNRLAPEYHNIELGVGETLLMKAVAQATGRTVDKIKAEVTSKGDLGLVAESSRGNQRVMFAFPKLTVSSVFTKFKEIAEMSGNSVMSKKTSKIQALFSACRDCEAKYIIRSLSGKLRIGLAEQSVLSALSQGVTLTPPSQKYPPEVLNSSTSMSKDSFKKLLDANTLILKTTYCECPNYDMIVPILLKEGLAELPNRCQLSPGIPLKPMLAHPANSLDEVLRRFDGSEFTCEFKYDGERAQIHKLEDGSVKIYSRNQEDNTSKYPDVIARLSRALASDTKSCILDAEIVAWDPEAQQIRPFQILSTRKRKDAVDSEITVQVCILAFDLLYVNGEALVKKTLRERRDLLHKYFKEVQNEFTFVNAMDGNNTEVMQEFLEESIKGNCEGLMVKALDAAATYEIAKRSHNWLKLKKDYLEGVGDTLDLVVIGGWFGKGKRTGSYGGFLLACYDSETEEFQTICKIGTGFKDEDLEMHAKFFKEHTISAAKSYYRYDSGMEPDQWFDACQVWEVKCADLSISPVHKAASGIVDPVRGISLRFPRFLRIRDDKKPDDATTSVQVADMYNSQEQVQNQATKDSKPDDLDFY